MQKRFMPKHSMRDKGIYIVHYSFTPQSLQSINDIITFLEVDLLHIQCPHENALILIVKISRFDVCKLFIHVFAYK